MKIKADKEAERARQNVAAAAIIEEEEDEDEDEDDTNITQHADEGMEVLDEDVIEPTKHTPVSS